MVQVKASKLTPWLWARTLGVVETDATTFLDRAGLWNFDFLSNSVLLLFLLALTDFFNIGVFRPYFLVCYGLLGLWLAIGLDDFIRRFIKNPEFQASGTVTIAC